MTDNQNSPPMTTELEKPEGFDDFAPEGIKQLVSDHMDMLDQWHASRGIVTERAEMKATIASLTAKLAEIDQERDRADNAQAYANEQFIRAEAAEAKSARLEAALKPFALPNGWHFIAYNKTGSTACPLNAGEVELARAALAGGGQATPGSGGTVDGGGCDL